MKTQYFSQNKISFKISPSNYRSIFLGTNYKNCFKMLMRSEKVNTRRGTRVVIINYNISEPKTKYISCWKWCSKAYKTHKDWMIQVIFGNWILFRAANGVVVKMYIVHTTIEPPDSSILTRYDKCRDDCKCMVEIGLWSHKGHSITRPHRWKVEWVLWVKWSYYKQVWLLGNNRLMSHYPLTRPLPLWLAWNYNQLKVHVNIWYTSVTKFLVSKWISLIFFNN